MEVTGEWDYIKLNARVCVLNLEVSQFLVFMAYENCKVRKNITKCEAASYIMDLLWIFLLLLLERNNLRICKTFEKQTLKNKAGCLGEQSGVQSWSNCKLYTLEVDTHFRTNLASLLSQTFINQHAWDCGKFKEKCNSCFVFSFLKVWFVECSFLMLVAAAGDKSSLQRRGSGLIRWVGIGGCGIWAVCWEHGLCILHS